MLPGCALAFLAHGGETDVTSSGGSGQRSDGTLRDAAFVEGVISRGPSSEVVDGDRSAGPCEFSATIQ